MSLAVKSKKFAAVLCAAAAAFALASAPAVAGHDGSCDYAFEDGNLCTYRHSSYQGGMLDFTRTDRNYTSAADVFYAAHLEPTGININDQVSSIVNNEGYCEWWLYENAEFGGSGFTMLNINPAYSDLGNYNDRLSSHYKWTGSKECTNGSTG
ncbi:peptidase inhibitor family I36 protein [Nonomuraea sp. ATR24]|uniref:peptidase inhibitor family I36 protein n=1 Tax=Nonomuraea TaxID=83681 RepID=UPI001C5F86F6|nr:peptidase inhibitor family I36 protein [Nonomuraea ceibae]